jgi:L-lactate dehydrogenase complex protein LldG
MSDSRELLLAKLRKQTIEGVELPEVVNGHWIRFPDPAKQFADSIKFVGGDCESLSSIEELPRRLDQFEQFRQAKRIFSTIPEVAGNVHMEEVQSPHSLENLDFVVYPGVFAVAENGAIWLTDRDLKQRVVFFITQFLVLVVRRSEIVHTMHEAYARAQPPQPGFGLFLSGPSKTADIEQSLVIGAHGCRELQVYLVP